MKFTTGGVKYSHEWCRWFNLFINENNEFILRFRYHNTLSFKNQPSFNKRGIKFYHQKREYSNHYEVPNSGYTLGITGKTWYLLIDTEYYSEKMDLKLPEDKFLKELQDAGYE